ncbi:acyltransferase [Kordiimonas sp.]|uniref:acyltransferase n=1 Tax=Kordiimonas sp. TaxID=1970157 RepID=UPI003A92C900
MVRSLLERFLSHSKGLDYRIAPEVGTLELLSLAMRQGVALTRGLFFRRQMVFLEPGVTFRSSARISVGRFSKIGRGCLIEGLSENGIEIGRGVSLGRYGRMRATATLNDLGIGVKIGDFVGMGDNFYLGAFGGIEIGAETIIGERLTIHSDNHDFDDTATAIRLQGTTKLPVRIGTRCWLGSNITILGGVTVGDDCVIGAGAVVTKSFPRGSIIVGNPARVVRNRFANSQKDEPSPDLTFSS